VAPSVSAVVDVANLKKKRSIFSYITEFYRSYTNSNTSQTSSRSQYVGDVFAAICECLKSHTLTHNTYLALLEVVMGLKVCVGVCVCWCLCDVCDGDDSHTDGVLAWFVGHCKRCEGLCEQAQGRRRDASPHTE